MNNKLPWWKKALMALGYVPAVIVGLWMLLWTASSVLGMNLMAWEQLKFAAGLWVKLWEFLKWLVGAA